MKLLFSILCISSAFAVSLPPTSSPFKNGGYKDGQVYEYDLDQHVITGLPKGSTMYTGFKISGNLKLVPTSSSQNGLHMSFKLDNIKIRRKADGLQTDLRPDERLPESEFRDIDYDVDSSVKSELYDQLEKPWSVKFEDGNVQQVLFTNGDSEWSKNIKKGIVNMGNFNMNPSDSECVRRKDVSLPDKDDKDDRSSHSKSGYSKSCDLDVDGPDSDVHNRIYEDGIGGTCETEYTVIRTPGHFNPTGMESYNVSKIRNYENCRKRPTDTSFQAFDLSSIDKSQRTFMRSPTKTQINLIGSPDSYIFDRIVMNGQHIFTPFGDDGGSATTFTRFEMQRIGQNSGSRPSWVDQPSQQDDNGLWYRFEDYNFVDSSIGQDDKLSLMKNILNKVSDDSQLDFTDPESGSSIIHAFQVLRTMNFDDLDKFYSSQCSSDKLKKTFFDLLPSCGTPYSSKYLLKCLKDSNHDIYRLLSKVELHMTLGFLGKTPDSTKENLDDLFDLCSTYEQQSSGIIGRQSDIAPLAHTCYLSYTNMLNGLCQCEYAPIDTTGQRHVPRRYNYEKTCNVSKCSPGDVTKYVQRIMTNLNKVLRDPSRLGCTYAYLQSLQNLDMLPESTVRDIADIITDQSLPKTVRTTAVYSLGRISRYNQDLINDILMPVYHDQSESSELRIACFEIMLKSCIYNDPSIVRHLSQNVRDEPDYSVRSYVYSTIKSFSDVDPEDAQVPVKELCQVCRESIKLIDPTEQGLEYDNIISFGKRFENMDFNLFGKYFSIKGNESFVPNTIGFKAFGDFSGLHTDVINIGVHTQGLEGLPELLLKQKPSSKSKPDEIKNVDLKTIKSKYSEKPGMTIWFNWMDSAMFVWTLDMSQVSKLLSISEVMNKLSSINVDMRKRMVPVYEYYGIPTELGIPVYKDVHVATSLDLKGSFGIETTPPLSSTSDLITKGVENIKFTSNIESTVNKRFLSRHFVRLHRVISGVKIDSGFTISKPVGLDLEFNTETREFQKKLTMNDGVDLRVDTNPSCFVKDMMKQDDKMIIEQNLIPDESVENVDISSDICGLSSESVCHIVRSLPVDVKIDGKVTYPSNEHFRRIPMWPASTPQKFTVRMNTKTDVGKTISLSWRWENSNEFNSKSSKFGLKQLDLPNGQTFSSDKSLPEHKLKLLSSPKKSSSGEMSSRILLKVKGDQESDDNCFHGQLLWTRKVDWTENVFDLQLTRPKRTQDIKPFDLCLRYEYTTTNEISFRDLYTMDVDDLIRANEGLSGNEKLEVRSGDKCQKSPIISGHGSGKKSPEWFSYQQNSLSKLPEYRQCSNDLSEGLTMLESRSCMKLVIFVSTLDDVRGQIDYSDSIDKSVKRMIGNFYETTLKPGLLRFGKCGGQSGQSMIVDPTSDGQGRSNQIVIEGKTCPKTETTNITWTTPIDTVRLVRYPLVGPTVLMSSSYYHRSLFDHKSSDKKDDMKKFITKSLSSRQVCKVKSDDKSDKKDKITTYDKYTQDLPELSSGQECYTVLSSDCSEYKQYTVSMKRISNDRHKDVLIQLKDKKIELISDGQSKISVKVDGQSYDLSPKEKYVQKDYESSGKVVSSDEHKPSSISIIPEVDSTNTKSSFVSLVKSIYGSHSDLGKDDLIVISKPKDDLVIVESPSLDLEVRTDGKDISILPPMTVMNKHCGICGNYNFNKHDDKTSSDGTHHSDMKSFYSSMTNKDSKCSLNY